jgi:UV DNA damage endonuclease
VLRHLGFVAMALGIDANTARTCRLRNANPGRLRELIGSNLCELESVLTYCAEREIHLYRISSDLIPFASHPINAIPWWEEFADRFERLGALIRRHAIRVSMHPGQFTVLNSTNPDVVTSSIAEVGWHVRLLDALGTGPSSKIVLHIGGAFGDKNAAMARFAAVVADLPEGYRRRIVVENDEHVFSVEDALEVSARTSLPVIYDNLHDAIHSGRHNVPGHLLSEVFSTWGEDDGPPKIHISTQALGGRPGQHADEIDPEDVLRVLDAAPPGRAFDAMLECKKKDLALLALREALRSRGVGESGAAA